MADDLDLTEHAARMRAHWNQDAPNWVASGRAAWERRSPGWGMWHVPEDEVHILPDVRGSDVLVADQVDLIGFDPTRYAGSFEAITVRWSGKHF